METSYKKSPFYNKKVLEEENKELKDKLVNSEAMVSILRAQIQSFQDNESQQCS